MNLNELKQLKEKTNGIVETLKNDYKVIQDDYKNKIEKVTKNFQSSFDFINDYYDLMKNNEICLSTNVNSYRMKEDFSQDFISKFMEFERKVRSKLSEIVYSVYTVDNYKKIYSYELADDVFITMNSKDKGDDLHFFFTIRRKTNGYNGTLYNLMLGSKEVSFKEYSYGSWNDCINSDDTVNLKNFLIELKDDMEKILQSFTEEFFNLKLKLQKDKNDGLIDSVMKITKE